MSRILPGDANTLLHTHPYNFDSPPKKTDLGKENPESHSIRYGLRNRALYGTRTGITPFEQIELQAKLLNYFLGSNKSNINQTGVWRQMSTLRRRYEKWCKGDDIEDCTRKRESSKRNYYIISPRVIIKAIIIINDMRNRIKEWWRSCSRTLGLMTENSWNHVCELGQSKTISITLHMARGRQT